MKKLFLLFFICCLSLSMSARVAYLLPNGCAYNGPVDNDDNANISGLPSENMDGVNQDPEWRAAQWFYDEYVRSGKGEFVAVGDFGTKYNQFSTIWIHLDRDNVAEDIFSYYNNDGDFLNHLKAFVAAGGNLLLSKHASQLLGDGKLNRLVRPETEGSNVEQRFSPEYPRKGYDWSDGEVKWYIATNFNGRDNSAHYVYNNMQGGFSENCKNVECLLVADHKHHTDFNCGIPRDWIHVRMNPDDAYDVQKPKVDKFEEVCNCHIIGTWGNNEWMQYGGFVEFYPKGDAFKGTILMYGLAAYNWCANNFGYAYENVQRLTRNGINYLQGSAYWGDGGAPHDGKAGESYICSPLSAFEGYHIDLVSTDTEVASFDGGTLHLNKPGTTTIKAIYTGNGIKSCKTEIVLSQEITVSAPTLDWTHQPDEAAVAEDKPAAQASCDVAGLTVYYRSLNTEVATIDANTGKIAYLKPTGKPGDDPYGTVTFEAFVTVAGSEYKIQSAVKIFAPLADWVTTPTANALVGVDMPIAANVRYGAATLGFDCVNCSIVDGKLHFDQAGVATVKPYAQAGGVKYYNYEGMGDQKTIQVYDPATANPSAATAFLLLGDANELPESERNCAEWFLNGNVANSTGRYLTLADLSNIPATVKTIIIHADRQAPVFDFTSYASNLAAWVKAGGNLVLMRQATMLAYKMNRIDYAPHNEPLVMTDNPQKEGMGGRTETDFTSINVCLGTRNDLTPNSKGETVVDRSGDDFFNGMTITPGANGQKLITLNTATRRASNCCFWQEMYFQNPGSEDVNDFATESRARFDTFESKYNCDVLAVEAGILDFCLPAIIRFKRGMYNSEMWNGSIMAIGAGGFQFNNDNQANFEVLDKVAENAKEYVAGSGCSNCFRITIR